jgi:oxygen-dependent protoporphyrinogen oxidase
MTVAIIGGGISGLAGAYFLQRAGVAVTLLEQTARPGGVIETARQDGYQFEAGPQSFLSSAETDDLLSELHLPEQTLEANSRAPRFIFCNGKLHKAPLGPPDLLGTQLLSLSTKLTLFLEPFRRTRPPDGDESIAAFVRRKFADDLLENMVGPLVSGIHAGHPERLSVRSAFPFLYEWERDHGSVIRGAMKSRPKSPAKKPVLTSFRDGLAVFVEALAAQLGASVRTNTRVISIERQPLSEKAPFVLRVSRSGQEETLTADALVVATDAGTAAELLGPLAGGAARRLNEIEYAPVAVVGLGYRREEVAHPLQGFGFLVPRKENLSILGTIWCSSLFAGRAPESSVNLTSFVGGATNPQCVQLSDAELIARVERELRPILGIRGQPATHFLRRWPRALPQYNLGHAEVLLAVREAVRNVPGLFLAGNYLRGPSIAACIAQAKETAEEVQGFLRRSA